jgi:GrpB-like predicted nucleotidyltransferase (UPF0157 family)
MAKPLSEMSLQELWQLFPIFLTEHQQQWEGWFEEEAVALQKLFSQKQGIRISHIGSTAIKGICAKPIIDILVEVSQNTNLNEVKKDLISNGYICMSESEKGISLNKGYTENGFAEKVFHLHLRYFGNNDELYFRDFLNENPEIAKQYEKLKLFLWKKFEHDRDRYTESKANFILEQTKRTKGKYGNRY